MSIERQRKWDQRYLEMAVLVGQWSKDPSTKVGAVLVRPNNSVAGTGYNGFPPGADDSPHLYEDRVYKYAHIVHAEINALNFSGSRAEGHTLYTSFPCCPSCTYAAGLWGVTRIVSPPLPIAGREQEWIDHWEAVTAKARQYAEQRGIKMDYITLAAAGV